MGPKLESAGVVTPWESGNRGNTSDWSERDKKSGDWQAKDAKTPSGTGREWDHSYEKKNSNDGTDQNQAY